MKLGNNSGRTEDLELISLIKNNTDIELEKVMTHQEIFTLVKSEAETFVNYIFQENILNKVFGYIFSNNENYSPEQSKTQKNLMSILSNYCSRLQDRINSSDEFVKVFSDFVSDEKHVKDSYIFGNFARIVDIQTRSSSGAFIKKIGQIPQFLIDNVNFLAARELLTLFFLDFTTYYTTDELNIVAKYITDKMSGENGFLLATLLKEVIKEKHQDLLQYFQKRSILTTLFEISVKPRTNSIADITISEIFILLDMLLEGKENLRSILVETYKDKFEFDPNVVNCATISSLRVFPQNLDLFVPRFFEHPPITMLNETFIYVLRTLDSYYLAEFVSKNQILKKIQDKWDTEKLNGHMFELAMTCASDNIVIQKCRGWFKFRDKELYKYFSEKRQSILVNQQSTFQQTKPTSSLTLQSPFSTVISPETRPKVYFLDDINPIT